MQIHLKQAEITAAIKQYVAAQGIALQGKEVGIAFTAGRKESGISAEVSIEDIDIPGLDEIKDNASAPVLGLVKTTPAQQEAPVVQAQAEAEAPVKTTSLFS